MERVSVRKEDLPVTVSDGVESRSTEIGAYTIAFESYPAGFAVGADLLAGLPDDACHCPHWGYLLRGELRIPFTDGRVATIRAGEAYYVPPGHRFEVVADAEAVEFSPTRELREVYAVIERNAQG
jgi:hypothetical protein